MEPAESERHRALETVGSPKQPGARPSRLQTTMDAGEDRLMPPFQIYRAADLQLLMYDPVRHVPASLAPLSTFAPFADLLSQILDFCSLPFETPNIDFQPLLFE